MNDTIARQRLQVRPRIALALAVFIGLAGVARITAAQARPQRPLDPIAAQMEPSRTVVYKQICGRELLLHLFEPVGHKLGDRRSAFVIFHGGGWTGSFFAPTNFSPRK